MEGQRKESDKGLGVRQVRVSGKMRGRDSRWSLPPLMWKRIAENTEELGQSVVRVRGSGEGEDLWLGRIGEEEEEEEGA